MKDLNSIRIFAQVAEFKNFSAAANRLELSASAVSKAITRLEQELGIRLFNRTTRSVSLTSDGACFLDCCRSVLTQIEGAETALNPARTPLHGRLRLHTSVGFGKRVVVPALAAFRRAYPGITVDVELTDRVVDLVYEGVDVAIVVGPIADERVIARKICDLQFVVCASPTYLREHGEPLTPDDLQHHKCLAYVIPQSGRYREWRFVKDGYAFSKTVSGDLNMNNAECLLEAALAGDGIVMLSTFVTAEAVIDGKLKILLRDYVAPGPSAWAVYLPNRSISPRVRVFVDFLLQLEPPSPL
jgi:LysR family transcriptional regulator for bpeEF and oprC